MANLQEDDITRLLSLDFDEIAGELGHSPEAAKSIVNEAILKNAPAKVSSIIENNPDLNPEIIRITENLKQFMMIADYGYLDHILESGDLFHSDKNGQNLLMKFFIDGNVFAVKYLLGFPFDLSYSDNEGHDIFDLILMIGVGGNNETYKANLMQCSDMIIAKAEETPTFAYVMMMLKNSPNFHQYEELYDKALLSSEINEINRFGSTLLHKAATFGDVRILKVLVNYGADMSKRNGKGENVLDIAKTMVMCSPATQLFEEIVEILNNKQNDI